MDGVKILVIDGQGGKIGREIVAQLTAQKKAFEITAVGTNSMATAAMLRAGATRSATGENPVVVGAARADFIVGPMGILAANSLLGEVTPAMALAVSESPAQKVLIPMNQCHIYVAGVQEQPLSEYIAQAVALILEHS